MSTDERITITRAQLMSWLTQVSVCSDLWTSLKDFVASDYATPARLSRDSKENIGAAIMDICARHDVTPYSLLWSETDGGLGSMVEIKFLELPDAPLRSELRALNEKTGVEIFWSTGEGLK